MEAFWARKDLLHHWSNNLTTGDTIYETILCLWHFNLCITPVHFDHCNLVSTKWLGSMTAIFCGVFFPELAMVCWCSWWCWCVLKPLEANHFSVPRFVKKKLQDRLLAEFRDLRQELEEDRFFFELRPETRKWPGNDLYPLTTPWLGGIRKPRNLVAKSWKCLQLLAYGVPNRHPAQMTETEKFSTHRLDSKGKLPASITSTALYIYNYIEVYIGCIANSCFTLGCFKSQGRLWSFRLTST